MSVLRLNEFKALPGRFEELVTAFEAIVPQIRTIEGCVRCELLLKVSDGLDDDDKLIVLEVWDSVAAHKRSTTAIDPKDLEKVMPLLSQRPLGQYYQAVTE